MNKIKIRNRASFISKYRMLANEIAHQETLMKSDPDNMFYYAGVIEGLETGDKKYSSFLCVLQETKAKLELLKEDEEMYKDEISYNKGVLKGCRKALDIDYYLYKTPDISFDFLIYCENENISKLIDIAFSNEKCFDPDNPRGLRYRVFSNPNELKEFIPDTQTGFRSVTIVCVDKQLPEVDTVKSISEALNDNMALFFSYIKSSPVINADIWFVR